MNWYKQAQQKQPWELSKEELLSLSDEDFYEVSKQVWKSYADIYWSSKDDIVTDEEQALRDKINEAGDLVTEVHAIRVQEHQARQVSVGELIKSRKPWAVSKDEFIDYHKTGHIASDTYNNIWEHESSRKPSNVSKLVNTIQIGDKTIEFRQTGEHIRYVRLDDQREIVRDSKGLAEHYTDAEIIEKGYPIEETTVYAFDGERLIGWAGPSFGAVEIFVHPSYQKLGIGTALLKQHMSLFKNPNKRIGQATSAGTNLIGSYHKALVEQAIQEGKIDFHPDYPELGRRNELV